MEIRLVTIVHKRSKWNRDWRTGIQLRACGLGLLHELPIFRRGLTACSRIQLYPAASRVLGENRTTYLTYDWYRRIFHRYYVGSFYCINEFRNIFDTKVVFRNCLKSLTRMVFRTLSLSNLTPGCLCYWVASPIRHTDTYQERPCIYLGPRSRCLESVRFYKLILVF